MDMSSVNSALNDAIESWCGLKPIDYGPTDALSGLWTKSGHPSQYDAVGISSLMVCIRRRDVFKNCILAKIMVVDMFQVGGELQTKQDLFSYLRTCP